MEVFSDSCFKFCLVVLQDYCTRWFTVPDSRNVQGQSLHKHTRLQTMSRNCLDIKVPDSRQCPGTVLMYRYQRADSVQGHSVGKGTTQQTMSRDSPYVQVPESRQCSGTFHW